jgi:Family of unknown function (DUF6104)
MISNRSGYDRSNLFAHAPIASYSMWFTTGSGSPPTPSACEAGSPSGSPPRPARDEPHAEPVDFPLPFQALVISEPETAKRTSCTICGGARDNLTGVYFTDRGIEELAERRGEEQVSLEWLAEQLRRFVDLHPEFEAPIERLATWLARQDDDED